MICSKVTPPQKLRCLLATRNKGKVREIQAALAGPGLEFQSLLDLFELPEVQENGLTFADNARLKAQHYYRLTALPCLADDSGLMVDALQGAPGIYSARWAANDAQRIEKLLARLRGVKASKRSARFVCAICFSRGDSTIEVEGEAEGEILFEPRGKGGFGYDPIFYYPPLGRTFAELSLKEKTRVSHRACALEKLGDTHLIRSQ